MDEQQLQFIWKFGFFDKVNARTAIGEFIKVLSPGVQNSDAGPDFANARLIIGSTQWVGSVEVHVRASDWKRHSHQSDKSYDGVILHVVQHNDCEPMRTSSGVAIPVYEMRFDQSLANRYRQLMESQSFVPCRPLLSSVENFRLRMFLTRLAVERMEQRSVRIAEVLEQSGNDWEATFQRMLFRAFGFGVNAQPFEQLAQKIPVSCIAKHRGSLLQLEALLLGQAGLLNGEPTDEYHRRLLQEYSLLRAKFSLSPMEQHLWKFLRTRPVNFPTIRLAQLAALLHSDGNLIAKIMEVKMLKDCVAIFSVTPSEYWNEHYTFGKISDARSKQLGEKSVERIAANFVAPMLFAYGKNRSQEALCEVAVELLEHIAPEQNAQIEGWKSMGVKPQSMFESQALLHLKQAYCDQKKCLQCTIGQQILQDKKA
ncbi:MAG: DUF2851 family protein [Prevotellaceae bacterium]|jgi:hypothetical protein|nr:DUF2851 family protein [Prevotellaceae bacterium]